MFLVGPELAVQLGTGHMQAGRQAGRQGHCLCMPNSRLDMVLLACLLALLVVHWRSLVVLGFVLAGRCSVSRC